MIEVTLCCVSFYSLCVWFWKDFLCFMLNFALELWSYYLFPFWSQYGPIAHIDLKIPPRPPGYAFVEVSLKMLTFHSSSFFSPFSFFFGEKKSVVHSNQSILHHSLKRLVMLRMQFVVAMAMILMGIGYGYLLFNVSKCCMCRMDVV